MRLDIFVSENSEISRSRAQELIKKKMVKINGVVCTKPSKEINGKDIVQVEDFKNMYVSRAGNKLEKALKTFSVDVKQKTCLDIGSSTGGFSECLYRFGAGEIYSVDVGKDQFAEKLKNISNIHLFEETDIRVFSNFGYKFDVIVCDVSFIRVELIIPDIKLMCKPKTKIIILIKPQFEVGKSGLNKNGVVKSEMFINQAILNVKNAFIMNGFHFCDIIESPIKGRRGNREFLAYFEFL